MDLSFKTTICFISIFSCLSGTVFCQNRCSEKLKTAELRCTREASDWIKYSGRFQQCCRNIYLTYCMMTNLTPPCHFEIDQWLSPELQAWMVGNCKNYDKEFCKALLNECDLNSQKSIQECQESVKSNWTTDFVYSECCRSFAVEDCLKKHHLDLCYDESFTLASYWSKTMDYKNQEKCSRSDCDQSRWASILIYVLIVAIIIIITVIGLILFRFCMRRKRLSEHMETK